ncbi:hypothetical protein [uncultured Sphingomonas sp.]|uniref:hypothetical protein n=1 Tax=uncultured Sphingomonas sp. TaxID=158754 RepID=UPI0035C996D5
MTAQATSISPDVPDIRRSRPVPGSSELDFFTLTIRNDVKAETISGAGFRGGVKRVNWTNLTEWIGDFPDRAFLA